MVKVHYLHTIELVSHRMTTRAARFEKVCSGLASRGSIVQAPVGRARWGRLGGLCHSKAHYMVNICISQLLKRGWGSSFVPIIQLGK